MKLEVKLASETANARGMPGVWPAVVHELPDDAPEDPGKRYMTLHVLNAYTEQHRAVLDAWVAAEDARRRAHEQRERDNVADQKAAVLAKMGVTAEEWALLMRESR